MEKGQDSIFPTMEAFDLYSPEIDADPFPSYAVLRERYPCYWSEGAKLWILSRYDDIVEAARDWETFSSSQGNMIDELPGRAGATLGTTDPPRHDRLRALSQAAFSRKSTEQIIAPTLEIADRALDRVIERGAQGDEPLPRIEPTPGRRRPFLAGGVRCAGGFSFGRARFDRGFARAEILITQPKE